MASSSRSSSRRGTSGRSNNTQGGRRGTNSKNAEKAVQSQRSSRTPFKQSSPKPGDTFKRPANSKTVKASYSAPKTDSFAPQEDQHWRDVSDSFAVTSFDYKYATLFDLIKATAGKKDALIVALDHITDAGNMGAILRSAEVVGASGVLIPNKRSAPVNEAVYRTSAGAVQHLKVAREANLVTSIRRLQEEGFWVAAATEHAAQDIWQAPLEGRLVIVMGAEDTGVSRLVREVCDFEFKLPQRGVTQSLNVAQAFTAIAYEWLRKVNLQGSND